MIVEAMVVAVPMIVTVTGTVAMTLRPLVLSWWRGVVAVLVVVSVAAVAVVAHYGFKKTYPDMAK